MSKMFDFIKTPFNNDKEQSVSPFLCDQVKLFGVCKGPCLERHVLCKTLDKECLDIPSKCFISIQLTKILSASHFYGRILKYSTAKDPTKDENWVVVNDSFEKIKAELLNVSSQNTKIVHKNPTIGEIVMIETEHGNFFRAVVLNILSGWFSCSIKVNLIDVGYVKEISSSKVFVLPSHLKEFRPIAVEIIISSMEPIEENSSSINNWPVSTTKLVHGLLEPFILIDQEFVCKVELTLGTTVWVNWLLAKKCIKCSHFVCKLYKNSLILPKELFERNLARENSQIIDKLINLNNVAHVWKDELLSVDNSKNETSVVKKSNKSLFSCEDQTVTIDKEIKPQWAHLSDSITYEVSVDYVEDPKCILIRNLNFSDRLNALQTDIDEAINNNTVTKLRCASVGTICLAIAPEEYKYNRVLITNIEDQTANIFYVDYGGLYVVKSDTLLTIPSNLITKLPFQLIECNLSGFENIVHIEAVDKFCKRLLELANTKICLKVLSSSKDTQLTKGSRYEVVLFNNDININIMMSNEFNMYVNSAKIQNILNTVYKSSKYENENDNKFDEKYDNEFDEEDLKSHYDLVQNLIDNYNKEQGIKHESNFTTKSNHDAIVDNSIKLDKKQIVSNSENQINGVIEGNSFKTDGKQYLENLVDDNSVKMTDKQMVSNSENLGQDSIPHLNIKIKQKENFEIVKKYCLDCNDIPVIPQCFWYQDETWIYLKLNILSVTNYESSCTMDTITISVETNSVSYFFTSVLFAYVIEESFTCHIGFDGISIKVQKLVQVKYKWPRLLQCPKKHKYIIYDVDHIPEYTNFKRIWIKILNKYKMNADGKMLNISNYDSGNDYSDDSDSNEQIYED